MIESEQPILSSKKSRRTIIVVVIAGMFAVPAFMYLVVFPWLSASAFKSVDEIKVSEVESIRIQFLNHPLKQEDVGPIFLAKEDFDLILDPLRNSEVITVIPPSAHLGEYRVRFKDGRRGTIRLRWRKADKGQEEPLAALMGGAVLENGIVPPTYDIYYQIDSKMYKANHAMQLFDLGFRLAQHGHK